MVESSKDIDHEDGGIGHGIELPRSGASPMYTTWPDMLKHWPKTTFCIVANEFCERFSYYGMRTVLTFYLLNVLKFSANTSTIFFNAFTILCYLTPLLGSVVADGYIGKFWTIFSVSILYAIGQIILAVASVQNFQSSVHPWLDLLGLVVIAFGTGGIKPCVSAFGADQFEGHQERMLSLYFSMFYFSINAGSMISTFISPIFRSQPCLGQDSCYPMAFGIPAILMIVATGLFMSGSFWYEKPPPKENIFAEVGRVIFGAIGNKFSKRNTGPTPHWLDHYLDTHDCATDPRCIALQGTRKKNKCQKKEYVNDIKGFLNLLVMFIPVPIFWALYDQQGSIWLIQGIQMNCNVLGVMLLPDQMQTLNAILILIFIPLFQVIVYPLVSLCFNITPLRKMVAGGLLAALSFLVTGFVQLQVNTTLPVLPDAGHAYVSFMNVWEQGSPCNFTVTPMGTDLPAFATLSANTSMVDIKEENKQTFHITAGQYTFNVKYLPGCNADAKTKLPTSITYNFQDASATAKPSRTGVYFVAIGPLGAIVRETGVEKPTDGTGEFLFGLTVFTNEPYNFNMAVCRLGGDKFNADHPCDPTQPADFYFWETDYNDHTDDRESNITVIGRTDGMTATGYVFKPVKPGKWGLYFLLNRPKDVDHQTFSKEDTNVSDTGVTFEINGQGGVYSFLLTGKGAVLDQELSQHRNYHHVYQVVQDNSVSILWQVPQIVILTAAEILFSITGYEFAYSQSATSMKALVQAIWLLTTAIGDSIIVLITALNLFSNAAIEFFAYAGAMFVVIVVFALLSIFYYEYQFYNKGDDEEEDEEEETQEFGVVRVTSTGSFNNHGYIHEKDHMDHAWDVNEEDLKM